MILFIFKFFQSCCDFLILSFVMQPNPCNLCNRTPHFLISFLVAPSMCLLFYRYRFVSSIATLLGARSKYVLLLFFLSPNYYIKRFIFYQYPRFMFSISARIFLHKPFVSFAFSWDHITTQLNNHKLNCNLTSSSLHYSDSHR